MLFWAASVGSNASIAFQDFEAGTVQVNPIMSPLTQLPDLSSGRILVLGDLMLDRYISGAMRRISPEAPVPVLTKGDQYATLGGAGNVANNLAGLECPVHLISMCGDDQASQELEAILADKSIGRTLIRDRSRPTITKTRIVAQNQQVLRVDDEVVRPLDDGMRRQLLRAVFDAAAACQAVILSDYGKGIFLTAGLTEEVIAVCRDQGLPVFVDPKGSDWRRYQGATCITPNISELEHVAGTSSSPGDSWLVESAGVVRQRYQLDWLLVTRGPQGMYLTGGSGAETTIPTQAREVFDVSGAGDTVIAALAAGIAAGLTMPQAAWLANAAAGIVVGKRGTQPVLQRELQAALGGRFQDLAGMPADLQEARRTIRSWQESGQRVVFTNGCFDLLHPGHIHLLQGARRLGERLVVGLNSDASVKRLKGDSRPIIGERDRAVILNALDCVDAVVLFDEDTPLNLIRRLRPDILVKGSDYRLEEVVGKAEVEAYGGRVALVDILDGYSTTGIARRMNTD
jgi:D-beta-D-heptose 7-phosphate kinase/D-beta-D-heptose 1-phosphate adenosyltransferase